ncbi:MAG: M1 family metallopeptidase [Chitinophagales bacterium]
MKHLQYITLLLFSAIWLNAQTPTFDPPLSPRIANYDIDVTLDTETKMLHGIEKLTWKNTSKDTIRELQMHTYLNAFKNTASTFMVEAGGNVLGNNIKDVKEEYWGWVDVPSFLMGDSLELAPKMDYIQLDDGNKNDQTVLRIPLPYPILPDSTIEATLKFEAKLPKIMARVGYCKDGYLLAVQWFPKFGVYEPTGMRYATEGKWNCHQFHARSEFYADFGVYDVKITTPQDLVVGASGVLQEEKMNDDGTRTVYYRAEDVIDFAWTASPCFTETSETWEGVDIRLMLQPEHLINKDRFLKAAKAAITYMNDNVGLYPYPNLTIVCPPVEGLRSSAMEYPTLITVPSVYGLPEGIRTPEILTVHEYVHQYFMQMVASHEAEEAWLDEGLVSYYESRIMDATYGDKTSVVNLFGYRSGDLEMSRARYLNMDNPKISKTAVKPWQFPPVDEVKELSYSKPVTWLQTLEGMVGEQTMTEIMKTYFNRWKFRHPSGKDFIAVVNEIVCENHPNDFPNGMDWFFEQVLYGSDMCDYKVAAIHNNLVKPPIGLFDSENGQKNYFDEADQQQMLQNEPLQYYSTVNLYRLGEIRLPTEILVRFDDGSEILEQWDGEARFHQLTYTSPKQIISAHIDPKYKTAMDANYLNNSLTLQQDTSPLLKWSTKALFWMQNIMQLLVSLV